MIGLPTAKRLRELGFREIGGVEEAQRGLPSLEQILEEIRQQVEVGEIVFTTDVCVVVTYEPIPSGGDNIFLSISWEGEGLNDTEKAAQALVKILEAKKEESGA